MKKKEDARPFISIIIGVIICLLLLFLTFDHAQIARNPIFSVASGMVMTGLASMFVYFLIAVCFFPDE